MHRTLIIALAFISENRTQLDKSAHLQYTGLIIPDRQLRESRTK